MANISSGSGLLRTQSSVLRTGANPPIIPPSPSFTVQSGAGISERVFTSTSSAGTYPIVSYAWTFGDPASGASNTSSFQNPTHDFSSTGQDYTVTLVVTDSQGLSRQVQSIVTIPNAVDISSDLAIINSRIQQEALDEVTSGGGFDWMGTTSSRTAAQLIADQEGTAGYYLDGDPIPGGGPNEDTMYWTFRQLNNRILKMLAIWHFGEFEPARQGDSAVIDSAWLALKWVADNIDDIKHFWKGSWTPYAVFTPGLAGQVMSIFAVDALADPSGLIGGVTKDAILTSFGDEITGSTDGVRDLTKIPWSRQVTHNSFNNDNGANRGQKIGQGLKAAASYAYYTGDVTYLNELRNLALDLFTYEWGLKYYDFSPYITGWQDQDGLVPGNVITNHNDLGQEDSRARYQNTYLRNMVGWFFLTDGTQYNLPPANIDIFVALVTEGVRANMPRASFQKMWGGRYYDTQSDPWSSATVTVIRDQLVSLSDISQSQVAALNKAEILARRGLVVPDFDDFVYNSVTGTLEAWVGIDVGGTRYTTGHISVNLHRARQGDTVCGVAGREQQNDSGMHHTNGNTAVTFGQALPPFGSSEGYPTDVNIGDLNFGQHGREWALSGDFDSRIAHGQILHYQAVSETRARTYTKQVFNNILGGVVSPDKSVGNIGNQYWRNDARAEMQADIKTRHWQAYHGFRYLTHANFANEIGMVWFNQKSGVEIVNSPTQDFYFWVQLANQHGAVYNFGSGQTVHAAGASSNSVFPATNNGWIWQPVNPGTTTGFGRAVIFRGTNDLEFDCLGDRFACGINLGQNPVGVEVQFVDILTITLADLVELHDNFSTYFATVNTPGVQAAAWIPDSKHSICFWQGGQSYTLQDGNDISTDVPACLSVLPASGDYEVSVGDAEWRNFPSPGMGGSLRGVNIDIDTKPSTFMEWPYFNHPTERGNPPSQPKPPGDYYWGGTKTITI